MNKEEFDFLSGLLKKRSGLTLTEDKTYLIESRLLPIARSLGLQTISDLYQKLRMSPAEDLLVEVTEAMTTNESSFFRDIKPYEQLRQIVFPMVMQSLGVQKRIRIWSAACSTGQEPYSISMSIQEDAAKLAGWSFEILGTDLAAKVVNKAKQGIYSQFEVQRGVPTMLLLKYFTSLPDTSWQIKDNIRSMVQFKTHNLLDSYATLGKFDIIFVRNVLIYFDDPIKAEITSKVASILPPHGILILGATETLVDPKGLFTQLPEFRGAYKLKNQPA